ncbi:MAG TPA: beta-galactosidase [Chthoniobacterales bacterium]
MKRSALSKIFCPRRGRLQGAALLAFCCAGSLYATTLKPQPSGIYDLLNDPAHTGAVDLSLNPVIDNPNVDGYRLRISWAAIQPDNGDVYDWENIDAAIAVAAAHGKKLCISIAAGLWSPDWIYTTDPVVYKYVMQEIDPDTGLSIGNQPLPWDTAYLAKWNKFVAAFGARYDSNPALSYVVLGGFMEQFNLYLAGTDEDANAMTDLAENPPPGYPGLVTSYPDFSSAYTPVAESIITTYASSFPTTSLLLTLTPVIPGPIGQSLQNSISNWAKATFPDHLGTMVSALYAVPPPHAPPPALVTFPKGFQLVCRAIDDPARLYQDPDPVPLPETPIPLQDALEHGVSLAAKYIEVYEGDLTDASSQSVLAAERAKLQFNAGAPAAPTGLHILPL